MCSTRIIAFVAAVVLLPSPSVAQSSIQITPRVGMYVPVGFLARPSSDMDATFRQKHQVGTIAAGISAAVHRGPYKLEAGIDYSPSLVAVLDDRGTRDISSHVTLMNVRVGRTFKVDADWTVDVAAGGGLISRSGEAWETTSSTLDRAFTVAIGGSFEIVPGIAFRAGADWYLSRLTYTDSTVPPQHTPLRQDLFFRTGVAIPVR